jgi:hypothetical protein
MGKRVYVATKWKVEYDSSAGFNYKQEEFKDLLRALGAYVCEEEEGYSDNWEVPASDYKEALKFLKKHKEAIRNYDNGEVQDKIDSKYDGKFCLEDIYDGIMSSADEPDYDEAYNAVVDIMQDYWNQRAKKDDYMHFCAF